jgi:hypothetical protein
VTKVDAGIGIGVEAICVRTPVRDDVGHALEGFGISLTKEACYTAHVKNLSMPIPEIGISSDA